MREHVLPAAIGGGVAVLAVVAYSSIVGRHATGPVLSASAAAAAAPGMDPRLEERLRRLELRAGSTALHRASNESFPAAPPLRSAGDEWPPPPANVSPEEAAQQARDSLALRLVQFQGEPRSLTWANSTEQRLHADTRRFTGDSGVVFRELTCRTSTCVGTFEAADYESAGVAGRDLVHFDFSENCSRTVYLPPPDEHSRNRRYTGTLVLDCSEAARSETPPPQAPP